MVWRLSHEAFSRLHHVAVEAWMSAARRTLPSARKRVHSDFWLQRLFLGSKRAQLGFVAGA
jgi:hypothetical protein